MKHLLTGAVAFSLLVSLSACGGMEKPKPEEPVSTAEAVQPTELPGTEVVYDDRLVELCYGKSGTVTLETGETVEFDFSVPRLKADGPGGLALNRELEEVWLTLAEESETSLRMGGLSDVFQVGYETHWNGSLLSLALYAASPYWETIRQVYNYDFAADIWVRGYDVADYCGLTPDQLRNAVARAAGNWFDTHPEQYSVTGAELAELRARAVSMEALEETQLYLEHGAVMALPRMPWDFVSRIESMEVPVGTGDAIDMSIDSDWVKAVLKDHRLTLTFHEENAAEWNLSEDLQLETPYEVEGLCGTYTDMALGILGMEYRPFLFLTDINGRVTCCNIMACAEAGDRFYAVGPMDNIYDVVYYDYGVEDLGEAGEVSTLFAHNKLGEDISLNQPAYDITHILPRQLRETRWTEENMELTIGTEAGAQCIRWAYDGTCYDGWINYLGTDSHGMQFQVSLFTELSDTSQCRLTLPCPMFVDDVNGWVELRQGSGPLVPGIEAGGTITLYGS